MGFVLAKNIFGSYPLVSSCESAMFDSPFLASRRSHTYQSIHLLLDQVSTALIYLVTGKGSVCMCGGQPIDPLCVEANTHSCSTERSRILKLTPTVCYLRVSKYVSRQAHIWRKMSSGKYGATFSKKLPVKVGHLPALKRPTNLIMFYIVTQY